MNKVRLFQSIQWKIVIIYILLILIAMQLIGIYFIRSLESYYEEAFSENMNVQAGYLAVSVEKYLSQQRTDDSVSIREDIDNLVQNLFKDSTTEVQVMNQNGIVLSTNLAEKWMIGQKNTQAIVTQALSGLRNEAIRIDPKTGHRVKVFAIPIKKDSAPIGAIYLVSSMEKEYSIIRKINGILATATVVALLLTGGLGILLSRTITRPVKEITKQATAMAEGDFSTKVEIYAEDEIGKLGSAFNHLTTQLQKALAENETEREKIVSILTNMSDGVVALDGQGIVLLINEKAKEMLGVKEHGEGVPFQQLLPKDNPQFDPLRSIETGSHMIEWPAEHPGQLKLVIKMTSTPLKGSNYGDKGSIIVLQDVTEQEKLDRDQKEFVANVSHELRTPLTTIKSYVEALEEGAWEDRELAPRFLRVTRQETERMIRLVSDLLLLSRMDSSQTKFLKEHIDITDMIEDVVDRFAVQLRQMKIKMTVDITESLPPVLADQDRLDQVLDNLISNAIKYTPEYGEINIEAKIAEGPLPSVEVSVKDNGIGIPKKDLSRIFERFYRVDKARSRGMGGTGLGLSIAQEIIRAHGGAIKIESEINSGTVVTFTIPYLKGDESHG